MVCDKCKGSNIVTRKNYTHGRKSKSTTTKLCRDCSTVQKPQPKRRGRR